MCHLQGFLFFVFLNINYFNGKNFSDSIKFVIQESERRFNMKEPSINQYLVANCLYIIDELNILYESYDGEKLKKEADEKFNEMDITVRLGYPFRNTVHYATRKNGGSEKVQKINHDLYVEQQNFQIEVKYLKNWVSSSNTRAATKNWSAFQQDFNWLMDEIDDGKSGKVAFVIGWFNCVDSISRLIQLGKGNGAYPLVDDRKIAYFPFLMKKDDDAPMQTRNLTYSYVKAYSEMLITPSTARNGEYKCMFIGKERDKFHFAIYY